MDKHSIGLNAGIIWQILSDNVQRTYDELKKECGLSDCDLNAAIGWLAREDKIEFEPLPQKNEIAFIVHFNNYF
ncbi:winged helix-turn-helix domain-containing protein [Bacteroides sp. f07]|uniref:winged helix-turn-helix domain-containing protein n=1 Tax=Bacteroides sp. f07 TaxID=3132704 RepID=UPI0034B44ABF